MAKPRRCVRIFSRSPQRLATSCRCFETVEAMLIFDERLKPSFFGNIAWRGPRTIFVGRHHRAAAGVDGLSRLAAGADQPRDFEGRRLGRNAAPWVWIGDD